MLYFEQMESSTLIGLILYSGIFIIASVRQGCRVYARLSDRHATRKRRYRERPKPRGDIAFLAALLLLTPLCIGSGGWQLRKFGLDRAEGTVQVTASIAEISHMTPYRQRDYFLIRLETGEGEMLSLRTSEELLAEWVLAEGQTFVIDYFPHTRIICDAQKLD